MKNIYLCLLFLVLLGCNKTKPVANSEGNMSNKTIPSQIDIDSVAEERYGENFGKLESEDRNYTIVLTKSKNFEDLFASTDFFVIEMSTGKILHEDKLQSGIVRWQSKNVIKATYRDTTDEGEAKGAMKTYYFDLITQTKSDQQ